MDFNLESAEPKWSANDFKGAATTKGLNFFLKVADYNQLTESVDHYESGRSGS